MRRGNLISGNTGDGHLTSPAPATTGNVVAGNYIGTNAAGTAALGNGGAGASDHRRARATRIGTNGDGVSDSLERNVISGNARYGMHDRRRGDQPERRRRQLHRHQRRRDRRAGQRGDGVVIESGASDNTHRRRRPPAPATSSPATTGDGIEITGSGTVGQPRRGQLHRPERRRDRRGGQWPGRGLLNTGATDNTDRRDHRRARNVIGGNGNRGVFICTPAHSNSPTTGNVIAGNYIGTDASGLVPMSNHLNDAVSIDLSPGNTIGGTVAGAGNVLDGGRRLRGIFIYGDYAARAVRLRRRHPDRRQHHRPGRRRRDGGGLRQPV